MNFTYRIHAINYARFPAGKWKPVAYYLCRLKNYFLHSQILPWGAIRLKYLFFAPPFAANPIPFTEELNKEPLLLQGDPALLVFNSLFLGETS
jgi:hypothetical protein